MTADQTSIREKARSWRKRVRSINALWRSRYVAKLLAISIGQDSRTDMVHYGTAYGGWWIPQSLLSPTSVCYCGGVGQDVSFDLELIRQIGCAIHAFDPTPRVVEWVEQQNLPESFHFHPIGLWNEDTTLRFYVPANPDHISHSAVNIQATSQYVEVPVASIRTLMTRLGHPSIDLLKLDIEGAEGAVIDALFSDGVYPRVLCVEFDLPESPLQARRRVRNVVRNGYRLVKAENWNFTFVLDDWRTGS